MGNHESSCFNSRASTERAPPQLSVGGRLSTLMACRLRRAARRLVTRASCLSQQAWSPCTSCNIPRAEPMERGFTKRSNCGVGSGMAAPENISRGKKRVLKCLLSALSPKCCAVLWTITAAPSGLCIHQLCVEPGKSIS